MADKESLVRIMSYFERSEDVMAVAPSLVVYNPKNIFQGASLKFTGKSFEFSNLTGYLELAIETSRLIEQMA
jgi:hypothetical protein